MSLAPIPKTDRYLKMGFLKQRYSENIVFVSFLVRSFMIKLPSIILPLHTLHESGN